MTPLVLATKNKGKIDEIIQLLEGFDVDIKTLDNFGPIPEIIEDGSTFDDNAYKKASMTARILGLPALADDSGLVVDALDGAPGVFSSRFAGENATDEQKCAKILNLLENRSNRHAAFECVISIAVPSGAALTYEARCEGQIAYKPIGTGGFGYDPIFYYPPLKVTFAQMTAPEKSRVSHRGKAFQELKEEFNKVIEWIHQHLSPNDLLFSSRSAK